MDPPEWAVACLTWKNGILHGIIVIRRRDGAMALVEVPEDLDEVLQIFNRNLVFKYSERLSRAVEWALPDAEFAVYGDFAETALRDGETPAQLGALRSLVFEHFLGIDLGEFRLPQVHRLM